MEAARCQLCGNPMSSWLEVCGDLCVCMKCAATVTLSDLAGAGFAKVKPDTYQMNGDSLVTKDSPDEILNYQEAKERLSAMYDMKVDGKAISDFIPEIVEESYKWEMPEIVERIRKMGFATESAFYAHCNTLREGGYTPETSYTLMLESRYAVMKKLSHLVVDESAPKPLPEGYENNPLGAFVYDRMHNGDESEDIIGHGDLANTIELSWKWTVDDVVRYIKDLGFATESAFYAHCNALREGGYTDETSYALILESRYEWATIADEAGTHYNALEGQTPEEARELFIEGEREFAKEHPELYSDTDSLVTKETPDSDTDSGMDMSRLDPDKSYVD